MVALIDAAKGIDFPAEIALVVSNEPAAQGLERARAAGIATAVVDHRPYGKDRAAFERALQSAIEPHGIDLICLAGFMRLLTPWFIGQWERAAPQHPSGAAARLQRSRHPRARDRRRRASSTARRCISSCPKWIPARSSCRRPCRSCRTTPKPRLPRACSLWSIGSIRRRCGWSRKAAPPKAASGRMLIDGVAVSPAGRPAVGVAIACGRFIAAAALLAYSRTTNLGGRLHDRFSRAETPHSRRSRRSTTTRATSPGWWCAVPPAASCWCMGSTR